MYNCMRMVALFLMVGGLLLQTPSLGCEKEVELEDCQSVKRCLNSLTSDDLEITSVEEGNLWRILPDELWLSIFDPLNFRDIGSLHLVCKSWHKLAQDKMLSLPEQIILHPLSIVLKKLEHIKAIEEVLKKAIASCMQDPITRKAFFNSPDAYHKALLEPLAIRYVLQTAQLIPPLFESEITGYEIYKALQLNPGEHVEVLALENYAREVPPIPLKDGKFARDFCDYTQIYASHYKAFYLLSLLQLPSGDPFVNLLKNVKIKVSSYRSQFEREEEISYIMNGLLALDMSLLDYFDLIESCLNSSTQMLNQHTRESWEYFAQRFYRKAIIQRHASPEIFQKLTKLISLES